MTELPSDIADLWLSRCFSDVSARLARGEGRKAYGRNADVAEILRLLASPLPRHPIVLGRPGVGKSAVMLEVADLVRRNVGPEALRGVRVLSTSPQQLLSGLPPGDGWRTALPQLWAHLQTMGPILLLFHDVHDASGAGIRTMHEADLATMLAPLLAAPANALRILAEARDDRWRHLSATVPGFTALFVIAPLTEPEGESLAAILDAACGDLEIEHGVVITSAARRQALDLARRYLVNSALPGSALAILEEALASQGAGRELGAREVTTRFAQRTGLPVALLDESEPWDEDAVRTYFQRRVLGQDLAIEAVLQRLALLKAGIHDPSRPLGVFLFIGPTGVGKTELAKALSEFLFGREERLVRINMADYTEPWQFLQLFGDPDPSEPLERQRGQLTNRLDDQPFTVLLLDEFEKAFPNIFQRFLQLFDEGILINGAGEEINLRNSIMILTSNLAASLARRGALGFVKEGESMEQQIIRSAEEFFTPEFVNRMDQIVFFQPLTRATMRRIAYRELEKLFQREGIKRHDIQIELDDPVVDWIVARGYSERFGARYLRRQIEKSISYPIARALVAQPLQPGSLLRVYIRGTRPGQIEAAIVPADEVARLAGTVVEVGPSQRQRMTLTELREALPSLRNRVDRAAEVHEIERLRGERDQLLAAMSRPDFWDAPETSHRSLQQLGSISARVELIDSLVHALAEAEHLLERLRERADEATIGALSRLYQQIVADLDRAELDLYFVDTLDPHDAWVTVSGGEDGSAGEWVSDLIGMYIGWAKGRGFEAVVVEESVEQESRALVRARLRIAGHGAFALLRSESGLHRLVEGGDDGGRVTRLARVAVWPVVEPDDMALRPADLTLRGEPVSARGHFLKRLRSRVAIYHHPSDSTIECATDGSLHETEALALDLLRGRLTVEESAEHSSLLPTPATYWGDTVRTYQRHKEQGVRDLRTGTVVKSIRHVLAGRIDSFLTAALAQRRRD